MNLFELFVIYNLKSCFGSVTAGNVGQNIQSAGFELLKLSLFNDFAVNDSFNGRFLTFKVALEFRVQSKSAFFGAFIPVGDGVRTRERILGNVVTVAGNVCSRGVLACFVLCIELVRKVATFAIILKLYAFRKPQTHGVRIKCSIGVCEVVRIEVARYGYREGVLVDKTNAGEHFGSAFSFFTGVFAELIKADKGLTSSAGKLGRNSNRSRESNNSYKVVSCSDGGTIREGKSFVKSYGVGGSAIFVLGFGVFLNSGLAPNISAALIGFHSTITNGKTRDVLVGSAGGRTTPARITEVSAQLGGVTKDCTVRSSGCYIAGAITRITRVLGIIIRSRSASSQAQHHDQSEKQSHELSEFFHFKFLLLYYVSRKNITRLHNLYYTV